MGVFKLTDSFDTLGAMAKTPRDLAALTELLYTSEPCGPLSGSNLSHHLTREWKGISVGFVDVDEGQLPSSLLEPTEEYLEQRVCQSSETLFNGDVADQRSNSITRGTRGKF